LLSASRQAKPARTVVFARITLALMLTLALLGGVVPLSSIASSHECGMACCAGKPSHTAGSCSTAFSTEEEAETPVAPADEHSAHGHATHASRSEAEPATSAKQKGAAHHSPAHHSRASVKSNRTASVAPQTVMTTPCSPECAAASLGSSQVRRPRDPASLTLAARPRPPALTLFAGHFQSPIPQSAEARRSTRPRAPPSLLNNLSA
jgi:hypothetical protein